MSVRVGDEGPAWSWRRSLFAWEEEVVGELKLLLHNVTLQVNKADMLIWNLETSHDYSVRSAYNLLTVQPLAGATVACTSIWNMDVPLKVVLFAWRLFCDRLPTKDNLLRRGVIPNDSRMCVARCGSEETSNHLFLVGFLSFKLGKSITQKLFKHSIIWLNVIQIKMQSFITLRG